jgi:hypothetical protein
MLKKKERRGGWKLKIINSEARKHGTLVYLKRNEFEASKYLNKQTTFFVKENKNCANNTLSYYQEVHPLEERPWRALNRRQNWKQMYRWAIKSLMLMNEWINNYACFYENERFVCVLNSRVNRYIFTGWYLWV